MSEMPDFNERLAAIARELVSEPDMQATLQRVVEAAAHNLAGEVWASVSLVKQRREVQTPAATDDRAGRADRLQYELEEGPCLDAIWEHETFQIDDMTTDERYPRWARALVEETGIRSSLSLQLFTDAEQHSLGALNLYSPEPNAFDEQTRGEGLAFAAQAAFAVLTRLSQERNVKLREVARRLVDTGEIPGRAQR